MIHTCCMYNIGIGVVWPIFVLKSGNQGGDSKSDTVHYQSCTSSHVDGHITDEKQDMMYFHMLLLLLL